MKALPPFWLGILTALAVVGLSAAVAYGTTTQASTRAEAAPSDEARVNVTAWPGPPAVVTVHVPGQPAPTVNLTVQQPPPPAATATLEYREIFSARTVRNFSLTDFGSFTEAQVKGFLGMDASVENFTTCQVKLIPYRTGSPDWILQKRTAYLAEGFRLNTTWVPLIDAPYGMASNHTLTPETFSSGDADIAEFRLMGGSPEYPWVIEFRTTCYAPSA